MMTGLLDITKGDVFIFGLSAKRQMRYIRSIMGVCPQHDVLYDQLTGREHLELFATLKGVPEADIPAMVEKVLAETLLTVAADIPSGSYSGGMRRRLSIGIALLGDPKIVFLDEPTTGMDPCTRREVWDMIEKCKKGRVILLTTHSMEEADILGDRVCVMSHGRIQALGTTLRMKNLHGSGFKMTVMSEPGLGNNVKELFAQCTLNEGEHTGALPPVTDGEGNEKPMPVKIPLKLNAAIGDILEYQISKPKSQDDTTAIIHFLKYIEYIKCMDKSGLKEYSIGLSTLEEVFLKLSEDDAFSEGAEINMNVAKEESDAEPERPDSGTFDHIRALMVKNVTFQSRQLGICCCITLFPVFVMLLLLLLDSLLLYPNKVKLVCGATATAKEDCLKGLQGFYNFSAVMESTKKSRPAFSGFMEIGEISTRGRWGGKNSPVSLG